MARADYIYLVESATDGVVATFTVRHEMVDYLQHEGLMQEVQEGHAKVYRMPDNPRGTTSPDKVYYTSEELQKLMYRGKAA